MESSLQKQSSSSWPERPDLPGPTGRVHGTPHFLTVWCKHPAVKLLFANQQLSYGQGKSKDLEIIKGKSEEKEISKPVAKQDTSYQASFCPESSKLSLHVTRGLDLQDFQAAEARERLSRDVREAVPGEAPANQREGRVMLAGGRAGWWPHSRVRGRGWGGWW